MIKCLQGYRTKQFMFHYIKERKNFTRVQLKNFSNELKCL